MVISGCPTQSTLSDVVTETLGRPFRWLARGPDAFDCLGYVLWLYRAVFGIALPDPGLCRVEADLKEFAACFEPVDEPSTGDVIETKDRSQGALDHHVALVETPKWAAHCRRPTGVERQRICEFRQPVFYRHRGLA